MKNTFLIFALILCGISLSAQTYHPFPTKNAMWVESYQWATIINKHFHYFALKDQDTTINGKVYHKIYHSIDTTFTEDKLCGGIREENKRIYFYPIDSIGYPGQITTPSKKEEFALYDFSLQVGDSISTDTFRLSAPDYPGYLKVAKIDSILIGNDYRKAFHFGTTTSSGTLPNATWIEGVGNIKGLLYETGAECECARYSWLVCFFDENVNLYHSGNNDCFYYLNNTGVQINQDPKEFTIHPNPFKEFITIEYPSSEAAILEILSAHGKLVFKKEIDTSGSSKVNLSSLPAGLYLVKLKTGNKTLTEKILKL